jgi:hypothetical protein
MAENVNIDKLKSALTETLNGFGKVYVEAIQEVLEAKKKVASGDLYNSLRAEVIPDGETILSLAVYASDVMKYVEGGRLPSTKLPNIQEIIRWIQFKGIKPKTIKRKGINFKGNSFKKPLINDKTHKKIGVPRHKITKGYNTNINSYKAQQRLGFIIARSIQRDGINSTKIVAPIVKAVSPHMYKELTEVFTNNFRDALGQTLQKALTVDSNRVQIDVNL